MNVGRQLGLLAVWLVAMAVSDTARGQGIRYELGLRVRAMELEL